jgi:TolB-like protein/Flp pilus assembly protein TadD
MALPLPDKPSIAVLPFDNMSGDVEQDYFSDGMTEDLITDLSNVSDLFVISRNSTFTYKDKPVEVRQVAEALGVRYVLEGSVRRAGDEVRINAQLIDALSGYHVWADRYDGSLADVFALQDKVVSQIVSALAVSLTSVETGAGMNAETGVAEAYDAFLQGWELYRRDTREDTVAAIPFFERAIELDPDYGRAYAGLAVVYWRIADLGWYDDLGLVWLEVYDLAKSFVAKALERPTSVAYSISSRILASQGRRHEALAEIDRAIALDRNDPDNYISKSWILIFAGRPEEAEESARLAMRINPHFSPDYLHALGRALFYQERYEEAAEIFERVASRQPERKETYMRLAAAYGHLGRLEEAKAAVAKYNEIVAKRSYTPLTVQEVGLWFEATELFEDSAYPEPMFEGLRKAGVPEGAAPAREGFDVKSLVSSHVAENSNYFDVEGVPKVDVATVKAFSERGVAIVDVRDAGSYGRGHIPGAAGSRSANKVRVFSLFAPLQG